MIGLVLPTKYAQALFDTIQEKEDLNNIKDELDFVNFIFNKYEKLRRIIYHPGICVEEKSNLLKNIFQNYISEKTLNFLIFIISKKREKLFSKICDIFSEKVEEVNGIKRIEIQTAIKLDKTDKEKLTKNLEKVFKKKIKIDAKVKKGILGGVIIKEKNYLIDASVRQFLENLKYRLHEVKVKKPIKKHKKKAVKKNKTQKLKSKKKKQNKRR